MVCPPFTRSRTTFPATTFSPLRTLPFGCYALAVRSPPDCQPPQPWSTGPRFNPPAYATAFICSGRARRNTDKHTTAPGVFHVWGSADDSRFPSQFTVTHPRLTRAAPTRFTLRTQRLRARAPCELARFAAWPHRAAPLLTTVHGTTALPTFLLPRPTTPHWNPTLPDRAVPAPPHTVTPPSHLLLVHHRTPTTTPTCSTVVCWWVPGIARPDYTQPQCLPHTHPTYHCLAHTFTCPFGCMGLHLLLGSHCLPSQVCHTVAIYISWNPIRWCPALRSRILVGHFVYPTRLPVELPTALRHVAGLGRHAAPDLVPRPHHPTLTLPFTFHTRTRLRLPPTFLDACYPARFGCPVATPLVADTTFDTGFPFIRLYHLA